MRCAALFYHHLTNIAGPEDLAHLADNEYAVLAKYLNLPSTPKELLHDIHNLDGLLRR